jgi:hypothetical protein
MALQGKRGDSGGYLCRGTVPGQDLGRDLWWPSDRDELVGRFLGGWPADSQRAAAPETGSSESVGR